MGFWLSRKVAIVVSKALAETLAITFHIDEISLSLSHRRSAHSRFESLIWNSVFIYCFDLEWTKIHFRNSFQVNMCNRSEANAIHDKYRAPYFIHKWRCRICHSKMTWKIVPKNRLFAFTSYFAVPSTCKSCVVSIFSHLFRRALLSHTISYHEPLQMAGIHLALCCAVCFTVLLKLLHEH